VYSARVLLFLFTLK